MQDVNVELFVNMNVLVEGLFKVIENINESQIENTNNEVPIILELNNDIIGIRDFKQDKTSYTSDDIVIRNPSVILKYDKRLVQNLVQFKNFGNVSNVNNQTIAILNWITYMKFWQKAIEGFFDNTVNVMKQCLFKSDKTDPYAISTCPSVMLHAFNQIEDSQLEVFSGIFEEQLFPSEDRLKDIKKAIWNIVKFCSDLKIAVEKKFDYKVPEIQKEVKTTNMKIMETKKLNNMQLLLR